MTRIATMDRNRSPGGVLRRLSPGWRRSLTKMIAAMLRRGSAQREVARRPAGPLDLTAAHDCGAGRALQDYTRPPVSGAGSARRLHGLAEASRAGLLRR